jgi:hypothetical protein
MGFDVTRAALLRSTRSRGRDREGSLARHRLRFHLQEIDLAPGETLLGRSPECHVTIDDPLVSRVHARVVVHGDAATIEDLNSRNGVRVNGMLVREPTKLRDRDRIRIGTQEFLFHEVTSGPRIVGKSTGFLRNCEKCGTPFPEELGACPHCGGAGRRGQEESTLSGVLASSRPSWAMDLLFELIDRALELGRWEEAEEIMGRTETVLDDRLASSDPIADHEYKRLLSYASRVAQARHSPKWVKWTAAVCARAGLLPPADVVARLRTIPLPDSAEVVAALDILLLRASSSAYLRGSDEASSLAALQQWRRELGH